MINRVLLAVLALIVSGCAQSAHQTGLANFDHFVPALREALEAIGFPCPRIENANRPDQSVSIIVGHRPAI